MGRGAHTAVIMAGFTVTIVAVVVTHEIRAKRRARQLNAQLHRSRLARSQYWQVYADVLADLGSVGESPPGAGIPL